MWFLTDPVEEVFYLNLTDPVEVKIQWTKLFTGKKVNVLISQLL